MTFWCLEQSCRTDVRYFLVWWRFWWGWNPHNGWVLCWNLLGRCNLFPLRRFESTHHHFCYCHRHNRVKTCGRPHKFMNRMPPSARNIPVFLFGSLICTHCTNFPTHIRHSRQNKVYTACHHSTNLSGMEYLFCRYHPLGHSLRRSKWDIGLIWVLHTYHKWDGISRTGQHCRTIHDYRYSLAHCRRCWGHMFGRPLWFWSNPFGRRISYRSSLHARHIVGTGFWWGARRDGCTRR